MSDLDRQLAGWVESGLISPEQADAIRKAETGDVLRDTKEARTGLSPAIEAIGYLAGALFVAASGYWWPSFYSDLGSGQRIVLVIGLTLVFATAGAVTRNDTPAGGRLKAVLWAAAVLGVTASAGLVADSMEASDVTIVLVSSLGALAAAAGSWALHRSALANLMFLGSWIATAMSTIAFIDEDLIDEPITGLVVWAIGGVWMFLCWHSIVSPRRVGLVAGAMTAVIGAFVVQDLAQPGVGLALAAATILVIAAIGVKSRHLPLVGVAAIGFFFWSQQVASEIFDTEAGIAVGLSAAAGLLGITTMVLAKRGRRSSKQLVK